MVIEKVEYENILECFSNDNFFKEEVKWGKHEILISMIFLGLIFIGKSGWSLDYLDGKLHIGGFFQSQFRLHVGGQNPNNNFSLYPGQPAFYGKGNHKVSMFRNMWQLEVAYDHSPSLGFFTKIKYINESSAGLDHNLRNYEAFPLEYPGDLKLEEDRNMVQIEEIYADVTVGDLWLRLGKQ